jgi:type II secretory pathway predicted ATPase ExeA
VDLVDLPARARRRGAAVSSPAALPDPFGLTADPDGYVPRPATEEALAALVKTLREGSRPAALLGPPGLGKTLLLHLVGKRLDDRLRSVYLPYAALPLDELCAWALSLLGVTQSDDTIVDLLQIASELRLRGSGLLLLIDDVGAMPLPTARKLGDLIASSSGGLRLLAAAAEGPSASRMLAATGANVQSVRLLEPMSEEETGRYVAARLARARIPASVAARFDAATLRRIHRLSAGIPRRVHGVASSVLRGGIGESFDEEEIAQTAAAELAQVPDAAELAPVPDAAASVEEEVQPEFELPPWAAAREEARVERGPSARAVFATALLVGALAVAVSGMRSLLEPSGAIAPTTEIVLPPVIAETPPTVETSASVERPEGAEPEGVAAAPVEAPVAIEPPEEPPPAQAPEPPPPPETVDAPAVPSISTISVDLNARPWALIQVDGVDLGPTPIAGIPLLAGEHRFRARMPDGRVVERVVEVSEQNRFIVFE